MCAIAGSARLAAFHCEERRPWSQLEALMPVNPPSSFFLLLCRARYDALPADVKAAADANAAPLNTDAADFQPSTDVNELKQQAKMVRKRHDAERGSMELWVMASAKCAESCVRNSLAACSPWGVCIRVLFPATCALTDPVEHITLCKPSCTPLTAFSEKAGCDEGSCVLLSDTVGDQSRGLLV